MRDKKKHRTLIPILLAVCGSAAAEVPSIVQGEAGGAPSWVSESAATHHGEPRWELFSESGRTYLQEVLATHPSRHREAPAKPSEEALRHKCLWIGMAGEGVPPPGTFRPSDTLDALISNAEYVLVGQVVDQATGFLNAFPGTLYQIKVQRTLKGTVDPPAPGAEFLMFYPEGMVRLGSQHICSTTWRNYSKPARGLALIVFGYPDEQFRDGILKPRDQHVLFELPTGGVAYPRLLRQSLQETSLYGSFGHDESIDELVAALETRLEQETVK